MEVCKVIGFVIIVNLVAILQCASIGREWNNHNARVQNFKCSSPQPRSLRWDEVALESNLEDIHYMEVFPTLTVLHRCDSQAGCCKAFTHTCVPRKSDPVTLTFKLFPKKFSHGGHKIRHNMSYLQVTALNHTECECSLPEDKPKK